MKTGILWSLPKSAGTVLLIWSAALLTSDAGLLLAGPPGWVDPMILNSEPPVLIKHMRTEKSRIPQGIGLWKDVSDNELNSRFQDTSYRVIRFADAILKDTRSKPEELQEAVDTKIQTLEALWIYFGSKNLPEPRFPFDQPPGDEFYAGLRKSERPFLARAGAIQQLAVDKMTLKAWMVSQSEVSAKELESRILEHLAKCLPIAREAGEMSASQFTDLQSHLRFYEFLAVSQESRGYPDLVPPLIEVLRVIRDTGSASDNVRVRDLARAAALAARIRGLSLRGQTLQLSGPTTDGERFDLQDLRGRFVIVVFFRDTPDAAEALRGAQDVAQRFGDRGVKLVGVFLGSSESSLETALDGIRVTFPIVFDAERAADKQPQRSEVEYELTWAPYAMLVDGSGKVLALHTQTARLGEIVRLLLEATAGKG